MKKPVTITLTLLFLSAIVNNLNRGIISSEMITPYFFEPAIKISVAWYAKHICELLSFSLIILCVCYVQRTVEQHLSKVSWPGHNTLYVFVKVWHRIFWTIFIISIVDLFHYLISFRQMEWFFLIQNGIFFTMTSYYLYKAYRK